MTLLDALRRRPDVEAPELVAVDAADRLLLDEAAADVAAAPPGTVVTLDDAYGALTLGAVGLHGARDVRAHTDLVTGERALALNAAEVGLDGTFRSFPALDPAVLTGARVVLLRLPRGLDALDELAQLIAAHADPDVVVYAGGRLKHMTRAMNDVLARHLTDVHATLARGKARVLVARGVRPEPETATTYPRAERHDDVGLTVLAHGAAFASTRVDIGTRFLLEALTRTPLPDDVVQAVDLGCGTGVLATWLARELPHARVIATDQSAAAVASAAATAAENGVADRVVVLRDDVGGEIPDGSVDVVLCNPPFHVGAAVHTGAASGMFAAAARMLRPGGELWSVYNSHLRYKGELNRVVGPTQMAAQNPKFTVARSVARG